jgi:hypothetical protein
MLIENGERSISITFQQNQYPLKSIDVCFVRILSFDEMNDSFCILAIFGFSNHLYGDQYAFEKTQHGCQLLKGLISDLTVNHTKPITDEKELIQRTLSLLNDQKV